MSVPKLSSAEWGALLADRFFRPEYAGTYVLFYVDRPVLAELAGAAEEDAVQSLVACLLPQLRLRQPRELFGPLLKETASWKVSGADGPPPCLAALAVAVLAASEMRREGGRSSSNYHAWFGDLMQLGVPEIDRELLWEAYADAYPPLWRYLEWWLEDRHGGQLGKSTIAEDPRNTKLGFADSQTIFLSSDREKLSQFFRWIRLDPTDEMPSEELLQYFRLWVTRRDDLSLGAQRLIGEERLEQVQLGRLIAEAAGRWEGGVRDDEGRLEARLALTLTRPPRSTLGVSAPCPPGFPRELELDCLGQRISLEAEDFDSAIAADEQHWYGALPLPVGEEELRAGLRLATGERVLRLAPQWCYVLHMSRQLGCWASVDQIRPSEPAWIVVSDERLAELSELLGRRARPCWSAIEKEGIAPPGWSLIRDVVIDPVEAVEPEAFNRLMPRLSNRFSLSGGLPLPRGNRVYLTGGDPDVMLPPPLGDEPPLPIELDQAAVGLAPGASLVSLAALAPPEGAHEVRIGAVRRRYSTVRSLRSVTPPVATAVGHELRMADGQLRPTSLDAARGADLAEDGARVTGSLVEAGGSVAVREARPLLILPRAATRRVLISEQPGLLESVEVPDEPPWMQRAGLQCQCFEHAPSIDARWLVTESRMKGLRVRRIDQDEARPEASVAEDVATWSQLILACVADSVQSEDREAWERLRELAGSVA